MLGERRPLGRVEAGSASRSRGSGLSRASSPPRIATLEVRDRCLDYSNPSKIQQVTTPESSQPSRGSCTHQCRTKRTVFPVECLGPDLNIERHGLGSPADAYFVPVPASAVRAHCGCGDVLGLPCSERSHLERVCGQLFGPDVIGNLPRQYKAVAALASLGKSARRIGNDRGLMLFMKFHRFIHN